MRAPGGYPAAPCVAAATPQAEGAVGHIAVSSSQAAPPAPAQAPDRALLEYLTEAYMAEEEFSPGVVGGLLARCSAQGVDWSLRSEDGLPMLHLVAMNEAVSPPTLMAAIRELVRCGAPLDAEDSDGDTALGAVMALAEDDEPQDPEQDADEARTKVKAAQMAAVRALLACEAEASQLHPERVWSLASWLRRNFPTRFHEELLADLRAMAGESEVEKAWCSELFLEYLEESAYERKSGVEAARVRDFLERGAVPGTKTNSATTLLLAVLNPYSTLEELKEVFRLLLTADPRVALERDSFKLSPLQWATDYTNVSLQHRLKKPNPATFLALLPAIVSLLPPELDAGEVCCKTSPGGFCTSVPFGGKGDAELRFLEGDRVRCRVECPGMAPAWEEGVVVGLWYRESLWPEDHPGAPYEVRLDIGTPVFALVDHDRIIRREFDSARRDRRPQEPQAAAGAAAGGAAAPKAKAKGGKRFQKRQREDGSWEKLDTVSGKARPSSPPDSDEED